jgi:hypothetical protein
VRGRRQPERVIRSIADWRELAPPAGGDKQWRPGRSALECARAWFRDDVARLPSELRALFDSHPTTRGLRVATALPEHKTYFSDGRFGPRNHDVLLLGTVVGRRTVVGLELKADEGLDRPLRTRLREALNARAEGTRTVFPERLERFAEALFGFSALDTSGVVDPRVGDLPYQLFSGVAGTIVEAKRHSAAQAVFVVHVLDSGTLSAAKLAANERGLAAFCRLLGLEVPTSDDWLLGPISYPGNDELPALPLLIGIAHGRSEPSRS